MSKTLITLGLLGGAAYLLWPKNKRKKTRVRPPVAPPAPPPPPSGRGNYVGGGWTWSRRDLFPTEASFQETLQYLGYRPGMADGNVLNDATRSAVMNLQRDYNAVKSHQTQGQWTDMIAVDGLIGPSTIVAFEEAVQIQESGVEGWPAVVARARRGSYAPTS